MALLVTLLAPGACSDEESPDPMESTIPEVAVTFASGAVTLCGTLSLPPGTIPGSAGSLSAALLIHGSGPIDRDSSIDSALVLNQDIDEEDGTLDTRVAFSPDLKIFQELAHFLNRRGYAVFRYDKRTWLTANGSPCGNPPMTGIFTVSVQDFNNDALAAMATLRNRPEVNRNSVFVIGHSQGAALALLQGSVDSSLRGVVTLGAPARPIDEILLAQIRGILSYLRTLPPTDVINSTIADVENQLAEAEDGFQRLRINQFTIQETLLGVGRIFWLSWLQLTDATEQTVRSLAVPALFVHGILDANVPAEEANVLAFWAGEQGTALLVENVTHMLNQATGSGYEQSVESSLLAAIATWMDARR